MRNRLFVLDLGRMRMARRSFFGDLADDDPSASETVTFPISAYLIEGPDGHVLYDTRCHPDAMKPHGRWSDSFKRLFPWSPSPAGEACHLPNRLEPLGLGPGDIRQVVLSHMHSDHAGCVEFFRKSRVIVHRAELDVALAYHQRRDSDSSYAWKDTDQWLRGDTNWRLVENHEQELSLTDTVTLLNWGAGHAAGMLGLDVSLDETGRVILASDAVFTTENFGPTARPAGYPVSAANAARTVEAIRARAQRMNARVWFGHDMNQFMSLRKSTEGWYE